jgi:hypothetical protein
MITYISTAGADKVISTGPARLKRIIFGADTGSAVIEVSNSATDGDGNIVLKLTGSTLMTSVGSLEVDAEFNMGICADIANQADTSFVWEPIAN